MKTAPLDLALRHIAETRNILAGLIKSSESFDYPKAKQALRDLDTKLKELGKVQADLEVSDYCQEAKVLTVHFQQRRFDRPPDHDSA